VASCGIRRLILGTQVPRESEVVREMLPDIPSFGMYASGEIAPVAPGRPSVIHQATMITVILGVRGQAPSWQPAPASAPPRSLEFLARRLDRSEKFRVRLENAHERDHAMLRTINDEIAQSRELIRQKNEELERLYAEIGREKQKSDELLLNILPGDVADELKRTGQVEPVYYDSVTVLFTDFKDFTRIAAHLSPHQLIRELDHFFSAFDGIIERHGLEKLKTIGDAYMCAGGIPAANQSHPLDAVRAAWDIQELMARELAERRRKGQPSWELRVGIHTGALMAGVIGNKKFAYDIWGDTVNIAARMESSGAPGRINISQSTYERVRAHFACEPRGKIAVKNAGEVDMYFVLAPV
jgi:class 3 adenylate cyclase